MKKDTCLIGRKSEAKALHFFIEQGYNVSLPFGGQARYDLLVDIGSQILRIQVKTGSYKEGCVIFCTSSSHYLQGHHVHTTYTKEDIDYFFVEYNNQCYLVPVEECGREKRLRIDEPNKFAPKSSINWAKDYLATEVLKALE